MACDDFTQADLDAINAAISKGVLSVGHGDKRVVYQSRSDMVRTRNMIKACLDDAAGNKRPPVHFTTHSKGLR